MNEIITSLLTGELGATTLLLLFILGILTKRFVPWWIHEDVLRKLEEYEEVAPGLVEEVSELIAILNDSSIDDDVKRRRASRVLTDKNEINHNSLQRRTRQRRTTRRKPVTKRKKHDNG